MKKILDILIFASLSIALFVSCEKSFLETEPLDKLVPTTFFKTEKDLELYTNSFYERMVPGGLAIATADALGEYTSKNISPPFIAGAYTSVNEPSWNWTNLRNINYFLEKANNPLIPIEARNHYMGVARFFEHIFIMIK